MFSVTDSSFTASNSSALFFNLETMNNFSSQELLHQPTNGTIPHQYHWGFLAFSVLPVLAILGNFLVIYSVIWEKSLQTSTNWLIVSLAFADFLVGLIVMPWGIYSLVRMSSCNLFLLTMTNQF